MLLDRRLGPVWWVERYADLQFAVGDPHTKVVSVLAAFESIRSMLAAAERSHTAELDQLIRRQAEDLFEDLRDPEHLTLLLEVLLHMRQVTGKDESILAQEHREAVLAALHGVHPERGAGGDR